MSQDGATDFFLESCFVQSTCVTRGESILIELSNHPSKISSTNKGRKQKRAAVNIHNFNTFNADEVDDATLMWKLYKIENLDDSVEW